MTFDPWWLHLLKRPPSSSIQPGCIREYYQISMIRQRRRQRNPRCQHAQIRQLEQSIRALTQTKSRSVPKASPRPQRYTPATKSDHALPETGGSKRSVRNDEHGISASHTHETSRDEEALSHSLSLILTRWMHACMHDSVGIVTKWLDWDCYNAKFLS